MALKLRLETNESKERWELIKKASDEVSGWDELRKAEAYRRAKPQDPSSIAAEEQRIYREPDID